MFKRITFAFIIVIVFIIGFNNKIKANFEYKINYYFNNELSDNSYYYEQDSKNYPVFEGFTFKDEVIKDKTINLYYETKEINIIINGNGGHYNGLEEITVKTIKYGETYVHNPLEINKYIFTKEGYNLETYERSFDRVIEAKEDIIYYAKWNREKIDYKFIINNDEVIVQQRKNDFINLPLFTTTKEFLGFYDENNNKYEPDYIISDNKNLNLYAKFKNDLDYITYNNEIIFRTLDEQKWQIKNNDSYLNGEFRNGYIIFKNLESNTNYQFKNNENKLITIKTNQNNFEKSHFFVNIDHKPHIVNNKYYIYYNQNNKVITEELFIYSEYITYEKRYFDDTPKLLQLSDLIDTTQFSEQFQFYNGIIELTDYEFEDIFLINGNYEIISNNKIKIVDVKVNETYYFIIINNNQYYYIKFILDDLDFKLEINNNNVEIINNSGYSYLFDGITYSDLNRVIENLSEHDLYKIEYNNKGIIFYKYFYTNNFNNNLTIDDLTLVLSDNKITINSIYPNYEYGLISEGESIFNMTWNDTNGNIMEFNNLKPANNYQLYVRSKSGYLHSVGIITTTKLSQDKVIPPKPEISFLEILENKIIFKNNFENEYSIDNLNWYSSDDDELEINNLDSYHNYNIYTRKKETESSSHSIAVLVGKIETLADKPSLDSIKNLNYDYKKINFTLIEGYNYYFNNELIETTEFSIDNLEENSSHLIKVERISDNLIYEYMLRLKIISKLDNEDKTVVYSKTSEYILIENSKENFTYIIKSNEDIVKTIKGNTKELIIYLESNFNYSIYILKDSDENNFYLEEYLVSIYIPPNLGKMIKEYLINNKFNNEESILKLINEQISKSYLVNNKDEFDSLYNNSVVKIDQAIEQLIKSENIKRIITVSVISLVVISSIVAIYLKRRKKVKL